MSGAKTRQHTQGRRRAAGRGLVAAGLQAALPVRHRAAWSSSAAGGRHACACGAARTRPSAPLVDGAESAVSAALDADTSSPAASPAAVPGSAAALRPASAGEDTTTSSSSNTLRCLAQTAVCLRRCASD